MTDSAIKLTDNDIEEFTQICKARGVSIPHATATERLYALVRAMELTYCPITKDELNEYENQHEQEPSSPIQ